MTQNICKFTGTGKSHIINLITNVITSIHPAKNRAFIKAGPTGIASKNIGGVTIHRAFHLPVQKSNEKIQYMKLGARLMSITRPMFAPVVYVLIDELSMISYIR